METHQITLTIESQLEHVAWVGITVRAVCEAIPEFADFADHAELCVVEACNNAIKHACQHEPQHEVKIRITHAADRLSFSICDTGKAFMPPTEKPTLDFDPNNPDTFPEGKMGLFIIHQLMDEVTYTSQHGENTMLLVKYAHSKSS